LVERRGARNVFLLTFGVWSLVALLFWLFGFTDLFSLFLLGM